MMVSMLWLLTLVLSLVTRVFGQRADGQYWPCNPLVNETCPPNPGLPTSSYTVDFTKQTQLPCEWSLAAYETVTYGDKGAVFTFAKRYDAPQIWTNFYMLFGRISTVMQIAPGKGIISSAVLISDDFDEIDQEFSGNNFGMSYGQGQNNYFGKGITGVYDRGAFFNVSSPSTQFHTYTIDWSPTAIVWSMDGSTVRTLLASDCKDKTHQFPQSPSKVQIGMWDGGDASEGPGTANWAGGYTDLSLAPFTMYVKSVTIENTHPATAYNYTNESGNWTSIQIINDKGSGGLCASSTSTTSVSSTLSVSSTSSVTSAKQINLSSTSQSVMTTATSSTGTSVAASIISPSGFSGDVTTPASQSTTKTAIASSASQSSTAKTLVFTICPTTSSNVVEMRTAAITSQTGIGPK